MRDRKTASSKNWRRGLHGHRVGDTKRTPEDRKQDRRKQSKQQRSSRRGNR